MLTTCFLAALFHGIVILGVTFSSTGSTADGKEAPALEVVWSMIRRERRQQSDAQYLSERSQKGSGNTLKRERTLIPKSSLMPVERSGIPSGDGLAAQQAGTETGDEELIATQRPSQKILYFAAPTAAAVPSQLPLLLEKRPDLAMTPNDDGVELRMRGEAMHQLWIAADTRNPMLRCTWTAGGARSSDVGTMNFPTRKAQALRHSGDRSDHRFRRQTPGNRRSAQQRARRNRRSCDANSEACRPV
jgi:protein TonB